jgi:hypothetical protein
MNYVTTRFSTEIFAGAIFRVVQYLAQLRYCIHYLSVANITEALSRATVLFAVHCVTWQCAIMGGVKPLWGCVFMHAQGPPPPSEHKL